MKQHEAKRSSFSGRIGFVLSAGFRGTGEYLEISVSGG